MRSARAAVTPVVRDPLDEGVVSQARAGDGAARAALVEAHYTPVARYLTQLTGDRDLAADLTQDAFLKAFQHFGQLKNDAAFAPWLYRIARNLWYSKLRWLQLRRAVSLDRLQELGDRPQASAALNALEFHAEQHDIRDTITALAPTDQEVLILRHVAGFGGREIGGILGISADAAQRRLNRAEERFRARYSERDSDQ